MLATPSVPNTPEQAVAKLIRWVLAPAGPQRCHIRVCKHSQSQTICYSSQSLHNGLFLVACNCPLPTHHCCLLDASTTQLVEICGVVTYCGAELQTEQQAEQSCEEHESTRDCQAIGSDEALGCCGYRLGQRDSICNEQRQSEGCDSQPVSAAGCAYASPQPG